MATAYPSTATRRPHPVHGILAAYPLAFFTGALASDIVYVNTAQMQWANFAVWLITAGLFFGVLAAVAGTVDAILNRSHSQSRPWSHSLATILMMAFALVNVFVHSRDAWTSVMPTGLTLSIIVAILALTTSWLGHTLEARQDVE